MYGCIKEHLVRACTCTCTYARILSLTVTPTVGVNRLSFFYSTLQSLKTFIIVLRTGITLCDWVTWLYAYRTEKPTPEAWSLSISDCHWLKSLQSIRLNSLIIVVHWITRLVPLSEDSHDDATPVPVGPLGVIVTVGPKFFQHVTTLQCNVLLGSTNKTCV
jgi:hypothetical protein